MYLSLHLYLLCNNKILRKKKQRTYLWKLPEAKYRNANMKQFPSNENVKKLVKYKCRPRDNIWW